MSTLSSSFANASYLLVLICLSTLCLVNSTVLLPEQDQEWLQWKAQHAKTYKNHREEVQRYEVWQTNRRQIKQHNTECGNRYTKALNHFSDMTEQEFASTYLMRESINRTHDNQLLGGSIRLESNYVKPDPEHPVPDHFDWRDYGVVTSVKNQGQCGSCWTFAACGALEGQMKDPFDLSEQQLLDCADVLYNNRGCDGGFYDNAYAYVKKYGIESLSDYKYEGEVEKCHYNKKETVINGLRGIVRAERGDEEGLKTMIALYGPASAAMDARNLQHYEKGVYNNDACSDSYLSHAVLIIGYGVDEHDGDYWLVKNSWSTAWGEDGYFRIARNAGNMCGIADFADVPLLPY